MVRVTIKSIRCGFMVVFILNGLLIGKIRFIGEGGKFKAESGKLKA
jgi:hypothetical protein